MSHRSGRTGPVAWDVHGGGPGAPLLLLHGVTDSGLCWAPLIDRWSGDREVLTVDLRGHGRSELPRETFAITTLAGDVAAVLESVVGRPVLAMGHSLGGLVAHELALSKPHLVAGVILEDPAWSRDRAVDADGVPDWLRPALASYVGVTLGELVARSRAANPDWEDDEHAPWAASKLQVSQALADVPHAWAERDWVETLDGVRVPVTLLTGDPGRGSIIDAAQVNRAQELLGPLLTHVAASTGHSIRREARGIVLRAVAEAQNAADQL